MYTCNFFFGRFSCMNCFYQPKKIDFWGTFFAKFMFHWHDLFAHHFAINNDDISLQFLGVFKHLHELTIQLNLSHRDTRPNSRNEYTVQVQLRYCYVGMHYWFWILLHNVWVAFWVGKDDANLKLWLAAGWYCLCLKYYVELSLI